MAAVQPLRYGGRKHCHPPPARREPCTGRGGSLLRNRSWSEGESNQEARKCVTRTKSFSRPRKKGSKNHASAMRTGSGGGLISVNVNGGRSGRTTANTERHGTTCPTITQGPGHTAGVKTALGESAIGTRRFVLR